MMRIHTLRLELSFFYWRNANQSVVQAHKGGAKREHGDGSSEEVSEDGESEGEGEEEQEQEEKEDSNEGPAGRRRPLHSRGRIAAAGVGGRGAEGAVKGAVKGFQWNSGGGGGGSAGSAQGDASFST